MGKTRSPAVAAVEALAGTQLGLFTLDQACRLGVTSQTIAYHARPDGRWRRLLPSVFELAWLPPDPHPCWRPNCGRAREPSSPTAPPA